MTKVPLTNLTIRVLTALILISAFVSCQKQGLRQKPALFDSNLKDLQLIGGMANTVSIHAKVWSVEYVKDRRSGSRLKDKNGAFMSLTDAGTIQLQAGWLTLEKQKGSDQLTISLKENFKAAPRKFSIGIRAGEKREEMSFTQSKGEAYTIVKKEMAEIPGSRREYTSDRDCSQLVLSNNSSVGKYMETGSIFKDVRYVSEFSSADENAFGWIGGPDTLISMDKIEKEGAIVWASPVRYKNGVSRAPFARGGSLEVPPFTTLKVRGTVHYLERKCRYTFTIKNKSSGYRFTVTGLWQQTVPLSTNIVIYE